MSGLSVVGVEQNVVQTLAIKEFPEEWGTP
jgi:hypothetical protein